ncbi:MAG: alpha amylase family protein [Chthonomonadales bacterium]
MLSLPIARHRIVWLSHAILPVALTSTMTLLPYTARCQPNVPPVGRTITTDLGLEGRVLWVDGAANLDRTTNLAGVQDIVRRCKQANISTIVVDVKPVVGQVLYNSKIAPRLRVWQGRPVPDFDVLQAFVDEGHRAGIEVAAALNVFSEGHKYVRQGFAYTKPQWQSVSYSATHALVASDGSRLPVRAPSDPLDPAAAVVYGEDHLILPSGTPGERLAVQLDNQGRVAGAMDPSLLDDEPLSAPEDGRLVLFEGSSLDWASTHLHVGDTVRFDVQSRLIPIADDAMERVAVFVNPVLPDVSAYELSLLEEVARNYPVDAIVLDRMRYANLYNDFSPATQAAFQQWLGKPVAHWPQDVFSFDPVPGEPIHPGPLFKPFLEFRAATIRRFLKLASARLRAIRPKLQIAAYVGSWYADYYPVGVNWGSEKYPVPYTWASDGYSGTGYAEFLDWLSTGCYYPIPTREDARSLGKDEGATVEAAADLSVQAVQSATPVYAGIYALDYASRPDDFAKAIQAARQHAQGVMIFDVSYLYDYGWWPILDKAFAEPALAPHQVQNLTAEIRCVVDQLR